MGAVMPVNPEYVPAEQFVHWAAPAKEYEPAGHAPHTPTACAPVLFEYVPAGQAVQSPTLLSPVVPE
jgi:hypothetical protein